jgi:hypothetical protein
MGRGVQLPKQQCKVRGDSCAQASCSARLDEGGGGGVDKCKVRGGRGGRRGMVQQQCRWGVKGEEGCCCPQHSSAGAERGQGGSWHGDLEGCVGSCYCSSRAGP